jgi:hypothetical protein
MRGSRLALTPATAQPPNPIINNSSVPGKSPAACNREPGMEISMKSHLKKPRRDSNPHRRGYVHNLDASAAPRSVYDGRDRCGSFKPQGGQWLALDRLGRPLGTYDSAAECVAAISAAGGVQ